MPGLNWIPGISQIKSVVQLVTGDVDGALQTQKDFFQECPVVSQGTSLGMLIAGEPEMALETQMKCLKTVSNVADGIPVVGHVKGVVHHVVGDHEGGNQALNAASRTTVVVGSGVVAGIASGGLAGIPAGIAAGAVYDTSHTLITDKPQGLYAGIENAIEQKNAGAIFDAVMVPVGDGVGGYNGGRIGSTLGKNMKISALEAARDSKQVAIDNELFGAHTMTEGDVLKLSNEVNALTGQISNLQTGSPVFWYDPKTNKVVSVKTMNPNFAVPLIHNIEVTEHEAQLLFPYQEDAIFADAYVQERGGSYRTSDAKRAKTHEYYSACVEGKYSAKTITAVYAGLAVLTASQLEPNGDNDGEKEKKKKKSWLPVYMPYRFSFTGAIMVNCAFQGLLHTAVRHGNQWRRVLLSNPFSGLPRFVLDQIEKIENAVKDTVSRSELVSFLSLLETIAWPIFVVLINLQIIIYRFIQDHVTSENYLGESCNTLGNLQMYWNIPGQNGSEQVLVTCLSRELFPPDSDLDNHPAARPIRLIITAFFISKDEFNRKMNGGSVLKEY